MKQISNHRYAKQRMSYKVRIVGLIKERNKLKVNNRVKMKIA